MPTIRPSLPPGCFVLAAAAVGLFPGAGMTDEEPLHARIDRIISAGLSERGLAPAQPSGDAEFLRRLSLDLTGIIPTAGEARRFLDDPDPAKRERLIDRLLASPEHALHLARVFDVMLLERRTSMGGSSTDVPPESWRAYLAGAFAENRPWDVMVREILGGDGSDAGRGASVRFYLARDVNPHQLTRDVGRLFLGVDLQCAQCHDDPRIPDYRQADYYGLYAFLERSKLHPVKPRGALLAEAATGKTTFTSVFTAKGGESLPALPGAPPIADPALPQGREYQVKPAPGVRGIPVYSRREKLAEHLPNPATPGFSANLANRLWALLFGRGLIHPVDLRHARNPPSHPELMAEMEEWLALHRFDIRGFLRELARSQTYQRSSMLPAGSPEPSEDAYAVAPLRGLSAEQFRWSLLQACGRVERLPEAKRDPSPPPGAAPVPSWRAHLDRLAPLERQTLPLLTAFATLPGQPESGFQPTVDQALHLMNSGRFLSLLQPESGTTLERLLDLPEAPMVAEHLYLQVLSRRPTAEEVAWLSGILGSAPDAAARRSALEALFRGLLLSAEFRLNH